MHNYMNEELIVQDKLVQPNWLAELFDYEGTSFFSQEYQMHMIEAFAKLRLQGKQRWARYCESEDRRMPP